MDFVDRVHGTGFQEIRPWKPRLAIPVEIVEVVRGTDSGLDVPLPVEPNAVKAKIVKKRGPKPKAK